MVWPERRARLCCLRPADSRPEGLWRRLRQYRKIANLFRHSGLTINTAAIFSAVILSVAAIITMILT
jgi:hypothetical protein